MTNTTKHYESTLKAQYETAKRMMRLDILEWKRMPGKVCQTTSNHSDFNRDAHTKLKDTEGYTVYLT